MLSQPAIGAGSQQDELTAVLDTIMNCVGDERHAFLVIQPAYITNDGLEHLPKPESLPQSCFVVVLSVERPDPVLTRNMAISFRVPKVVIDPVQNTAQFRPMHMKRVAKTGT